MSDEKTLTFGGERDVTATGEKPNTVTFNEEDLQNAMAEQLGLNQTRGAVEPSDPLIKKFKQTIGAGDVMDDINTSADAGRRGPDAMNTPATDGDPGVDQTQEGPITNNDGREFQSKEEYLTWKVGEDGRRWGEEKAALNERIAKLEGMVQGQGQQPAMNPAEQRNRLKQQLFANASRDEQETGYVSMDTLVDAFIQNGALLGQNLQQYLQPFIEKVEGVESRVSEVAARSKYSIDQQKEKAVLQKHPYLKNLPFEERMAVLAELAPKPESNGKQPLAPQRQRIPKPTAQEYVEGSVQSEPRSTGFEEFTAEFDKLDSRKQLNLLGGILKSSPEAQSLFKPPESF